MIGKLVLIVVLVGLLGVLVYFAYNLYLDNSTVIEELKAVQMNTSQPSYESELQFHPNMRFNKRGISYKVGEECEEDKVENMKAAFQFLENKTSLIFFEAEEADVNVNCGEQYLKEDLYVAGEGGPSKFVDTGLYNVILQGKIVLLYKDSCDYNIDLHELLHVLGFKHSANPNSIMYNLSTCKQVVTDDIINEINKLYEVAELSDLYFEQGIQASKHGTYLDIKFTVRNQGLIDADNVVVGIFSNGREIEVFDLGKIEFGAGKIYSVVNLRLLSRNIEKVEVYVDKENKIRELDETNNKVELSLAG